MREVGRCPSSFYVSQARGASFSIAQYPLRNSAILDSGTNIDVFNEISRFLNFHAAPDGDFLWAGTQKVRILGYGDVDIAVDGPVGKQLLQLNDVALCEDFTCNVVSFRKLKCRGVWWDTHSEQNCLKCADNFILALIKDLHE